MARYRVLLTDYAWPDLDIEREVLAQADAELVVAESKEEATLVAAAGDVDAVLTTWAHVTSKVLQVAPNCRIVARMGIGLDNIDVEYCTRHAIPVTNVPNYCVAEVAEHAIALLLALGRQVGFFHHQTKQGIYDLQAAANLRRIEGQTLGIIGLGNIGRRVARKAQALSLDVIAHTRTPPPPDATSLRIVSCEELLESSDYVSLHLPLTAATRRCIGRGELSQMKSSAYLINTARGGLVDTAALAAALEFDEIAGAALDVQDPEPPDLNQAPYNDPRVIVTPHASFVSEEAVQELRLTAASQVATRLRGDRPPHVVNGVE